MGHIFILGYTDRMYNSSILRYIPRQTGICGFGSDFQGWEGESAQDRETMNTAGAGR